MKISDLERALQIRYVDLCFDISFTEDSVLPEHKTSALRGGMGQMLLWQNCIGDRNCEKCGFEKECLVRRMMYSQFEIQPRFAGKGDSIGYVIECTDQREQISKGGKLRFHLLIFGKTIVYFSQFLQAFYMLGQYGIGKQHARYQIECITNQKGERVVDGTQVYFDRLNVSTICQYVEKRNNEIAGSDKKVVDFQSPVTIKYQGDIISEFNSEAIFRSVIRRIYSFDCFEGNELPLFEMEEELPEIAFQKASPVSVRRYSSRREEKVYLRGIEGVVIFDKLSEVQKMLLLAGERLHIGKNTSFGFGQYVVK